MKLFGRFTVLASFLMPAIAFAQDGGTNSNAGWIAMAAGLCMCVAAFGGALGQGKAASAALEGIARNPQAGKQLFTPMIIALALIESLVIYSLVIAFVLVGKI